MDQFSGAWEGVFAPQTKAHCNRCLDFHLLRAITSGRE